MNHEKSRAAVPRAILDIRAACGRAVGQAVGEHERTRIQAFLADGVFRLHQLALRPLDMAQVEREVDAHLAVIERRIPYLAEEIAGIADGAGITYQQAGLLQLRREILGYTPLPAAVDCTSFALSTGACAVVGQTVDLNGGMAELASLVRIGDDCETPSILMYTFAGLLGYVGMNSAGLAVAINLVLGGRWQAGIPPYLLVRHLLRMRTVEECIAALSMLPKASSRALTIADRENLVCVEFTPTKLRCTRGDRLYHTNHFLHPEMVEDESLNIFSRNGSLRRLARIAELLRVETVNSPAEHYCEALADHSLYPAGICVHNGGQIRREETVAAVVMEPALGVMHVRRGQPCSSRTERVSLHAN